MNYQNLLIDGSYLAHRSHLAPYTLTTSTGLNSKLIHSFLTSLKSLYNKYNPKQTVIAWESYPTISWRRELYPTYKPCNSDYSEYAELTIDLKFILRLLNIPQYYAPNNEADDVLANLSVRVTKPTLIFTVDKDLMQLVNDDIPVHILSKSKIFNESRVYDKYKVHPSQIPDLLAITGDKSDNIVGINGLGPKKTSDLLSQYDTLQAIPYHKFKGGEDDFQRATLNKKLTTLNYDCNIQPLYPDGSLISSSLDELLEKYELTQIQSSINKFKVIGNEKDY